MPSPTCLILNCTLKRSPDESSSELLGSQILSALTDHGVKGEMVRVVDHDVRFGVSIDEGDGDAWPQVRERMLAADALVLVSPIWLGQPSSVCKMVLERLDAELSETDADGRMLTYDKVAGFTIPANGSTYWVGEAMQAVGYKDKKPTPEKTAGTTKTLARNLAHVAGLLAESPYPAGE
ncbi:MAG TPA: NAD(P)H-dependent oxidoreductase [Jiangellaceae bacterium]